MIVALRFFFCGLILCSRFKINQSVKIIINQLFSRVYVNEIIVLFFFIGIRKFFLFINNELEVNFTKRAHFDKFKMSKPSGHFLRFKILKTNW
jgi:hypothetical protein